MTRDSSDRLNRLMTNARRRNVIASPHFGALEGLQGGSDALHALLAELETDGYLAPVERAWEGVRYTYPVPTALGLARLAEGRLFGDT